ncbi:LCP family protein [Streptomyces vinaceus]|uniref:LCP family protein n=1 Tax=Streptomyces vinaceus TaxID=1960 RepID=UPI0035DDA8CB
MTGRSTVGRRGYQAQRRRGRGSRRRVVRRSRLRILAWITAVVVVLGVTGAAALAYRLSSNIRSVDINSALDKERPAPADNGAMNILILGSDSRAEKTKTGKEPARSDTAMVVHVYTGRRQAALVSIPRDTLITRPSCTTASGAKDPGGARKMFNESYSVGGPACAVDTVERMSGLRMDHYIELDFTGFKKIIDKLGGVTVTTSKSIKDPASGLNLTAGTHTLNGTQSLGLVRTRKSVGDGSDLGRIQLQQAFVKALLAQVRQGGVLSNPARLFSLADTATKSMTTDKDLAGTAALVRFASALKDIDSSGLQALTLPVGPDTKDANRVVPLTTESRQVWEALRTDQPVPTTATARSMGDKGSTGALITP